MVTGCTCRPSRGRTNCSGRDRQAIAHGQGVVRRRGEEGDLGPAHRAMPCGIDAGHFPAHIAGGDAGKRGQGHAAGLVGMLDRHRGERAAEVGLLAEDQLRRLDRRRVVPIDVFEAGHEHRLAEVEIDVGAHALAGRGVFGLQIAIQQICRLPALRWKWSRRADDRGRIDRQNGGQRGAVSGRAATQQQPGKKTSHCGHEPVIHVDLLRSLLFPGPLSLRRFYPGAARVSNAAFL